MKFETINYNIFVFDCDKINAKESDNNKHVKFIIYLRLLLFDVFSNFHKIKNNNISNKYYVR